MRRFLPMRWAALLLLGPGCAPTYELTLRPASAPATPAAADSLALRLRFVRYEAGSLVFAAEGVNQGRQPVALGPANFALLASPLPAGPPAPTRTRRGAELPASVAAARQLGRAPVLPSGPVAALDPEWQIGALRQAARRAAAQAARPDALAPALTTASRAADLGSLGRRETPAQARDRADLRTTALNYSLAAASTQAQATRRAAQLDQQADQLTHQALPRTTLAPGQRLQGLLYFPRCDGADTLRLCLPGRPLNAGPAFVQTCRRQ